MNQNGLILFSAISANQFTSMNKNELIHLNESEQTIQVNESEQTDSLNGISTNWFSQRNQHKPNHLNELNFSSAIYSVTGQFSRAYLIVVSVRSAVKLHMQTTWYQNCHLLRKIASYWKSYTESMVKLATSRLLVISH